MTNPSVVIIDCGLSTTGGHHFPHLQVVLDELGMNPQDVMILTNQSVGVSQVAGVQVRSCLSRTGYEGMSRPNSRIETRACEGLGLDLLQNDAILAGADSLLVLNVTPVVLAGLMIWLRLRNRPFGGDLRLYMLTGIGIELRRAAPLPVYVEYKKEHANFFRSAIAELPLRAPAVKWHVTSPIRLRELKKLGAEPVSLYTLYSGKPQGGFAKQRLNKKNHILLFAGDAKAEKGLLHLPNLIRACHQAFPDKSLVAQINDSQDQFGGTLSRIQSETHDLPNFQLLLGRVSDKAYHRLISSAELVVLTHGQDHYRHMESGLANDCLRLDTPFLVRNGTLAAKNLAALGGGRFVYQNDQNIVGTLQDLLQNPCQTVQQFIQIANRYRPYLEYPAI